MTATPGDALPAPENTPRRARKTPRRRERRRWRPPPQRITVWAAATFAAAIASLIALAGRAGKAAVAIGLLSIFFAHLVAPAAQRLRRAAHRRRRRLSPTAALGLVYLALLVAIALTRVLIGDRLLQQMTLFTASVPSHVDHALRLTASAQQWQQWVGWSDSTSTVGRVVLSLSDWLRVHVAEVLVDALDYRWILPWFALIPVLSFLLLTQFALFRRSTLRGIAPGHLRWRVSEFLEQVNTVLAGYVRAQVLSAILVGIVSSAGLALLKVPYALLVGLAAGVLEFVPLLGPISAALLVAGLVQGGQLFAALTFLATLRIFQDTIVYPRLMGKRVHLSPLAVLLGVWLGAMGGGILGVLLAVPAIAVGAVALRQWRDYRQVEQLVRAHAAARELAAANAEATGQISQD